MVGRLLVALGAVKPLLAAWRADRDLGVEDVFAFAVSAVEGGRGGVAYHMLAVVCEGSVPDVCLVFGNYAVPVDHGCRKKGSRNARWMLRGWPAQVRTIDDCRSCSHSHPNSRKRPGPAIHDARNLVTDLPEHGRAP
jgi:hypothetical protein